MFVCRRRSGATGRGIWVSGCMFVCPPFVRLLQTGEHDILKVKTGFDADWQKWSTVLEHQVVNFGDLEVKI